MIPTAAVLHRGKHFDLLLTRELELIEREHEQNLITHKKLEKSIRHDNKQITNSNRKKFSITSIDEILYEKPRLSIASSINSDNQKQTPPKIFPRYYRHCFKAQRLPPIVKLNRRKQTNKDLHWIASLQPKNIQKENLNEELTLLNEELLKVSLPELTPIEKQIDSFMGTLPTYNGTQRGFDNFAPSSLYTIRAPVAMR